ncbi:hypothetical protein ACFPT7_13655 [Acidicapsa dinghuensis]|uniref:DUF3047 domain-containing protein n=1 Tax=Acidicapsa dinghuensis TaxID=2218256 RepID=A0ABW1EG99_9BACT|nr:hypothetical protein [Acidicapsa dinghuensis]
MRWLILLLLFANSGLSLWGQKKVTVAQVEEALRWDSRHDSKRGGRADKKAAGRLAEVLLTEQLSQDRFAALVAEAQPGEKTVEQLRMLMDASILMPPPKDEIANDPTPDIETQRAMVERAVQYVKDTLRHLPDFLATRETQSFNNKWMGPTEDKPQLWQMMPLHWVSATEERITYRDGAEVSATNGRDRTTSQPIAIGLTTSGEFGQLLGSVLRDAFAGSVRWSRWQLVKGKRVAVFHFAVPKELSHYAVDFCCGYWASEKQWEWEFHDRPAYDGEIYLDPDDGVVERITLQVEMAQTAPMASSMIGVWYGPVTIGEKEYVCPVRSVAVSQIRNAVTNQGRDWDFTQYVNEVRFLKYRKFGSEGRLVPVE